MFQKWIAIGNLGNDPDLRFTPGGQPVASFRFAVNKQWTGTDGTKQEKTVWFKVTAWGKLAEIVGKHLASGHRILVEGEITGSSAYLDRDGKPAASTEVTAQIVKFLTGPKAGQVASDDGASGAPEGLRDEDIPF